MYRRGMSYVEIAKHFGWKAHTSARDAVRRATLEAGGLTRDDAREILAHQLASLQDMRRHAWRVLATTHYVTTASGKVATHPETGAPLVDTGPVLGAIDRLVRIAEHEAKLTGIFAPTRARIDVITEDAVDRAIADLGAEIQRREAALVALAGRSPAAATMISAGDRHEAGSIGAPAESGA